MNYDLSRLGPIEFEDMVQSLWEGHFGITSSIYGSGPDGQREAVFQGKATVPKKDGKELDGYWVLQAKFKEKEDNKNFNWLSKKINEEMQGFQKKKEENEKRGKEIHKIPEIYLFFTNIVLSSVERAGSKDKILQLIKDNDYESIIPHIYVLGYDEIARMLDNNRNVATAYASFILPGDVLAYLYEKVTEEKKLRHNSLLRYIKNSFISNRRSRMDQQEEIEEAEGRKVYLEKVYIDLDYEGENLYGKFVQDALTIGNRQFRPQNIKEQRVQKETEWQDNFSKHIENINRLKKLDFERKGQPFNSNKYIVKGSAGQGKSTICQFLAQIYRAAFLKEFWIKIDEPDNDDGYGAFLETIKGENYKLPSCRRIPIFIDLKSYASWIYQRRDGKDKKSCDLVSYIVTQINEGANDNKFDTDTLRLYLRKFSWVFFFDGLDEVPESSNRGQVLQEINYFINIELEQANTDAVFFATTRPEGFVGNEFETVHFQQVQLLLLKDKDCYAYLEKLLTLLRGEDRAKEPLQILKGYLNPRGRSNDVQIKKMLGTPLQARIIALLVMNDGELPQDKYTLFQEYFNIIIKREKSKKVENMIHIFGKYEKQIRPLFYILGYTLQNKSAQIGKDAFITKDELLEIICKRLREKEFSDSEIKSDAPLICRLISERLNIAEEIRAGYIGFPIRSLQEYLTAKHLIITANGESCKWSKALSKMVVSSYWQNTFFLFLEGLQQETDDYLAAQINDILTGLNAGYSDKNEFEIISYGSQTALTLLHNHILKGSPDYEIRLFNILNNGLQNLVPSDELKYISHISMRIKTKWVNEIVQKKEAFLTEMDFVAMGILFMDNDRFPQDLKVNMKEFTENYAQEIVLSFVDTFSVIPYWMNSYVIALINEGYVLSIDRFYLDDVLHAIENKKGGNWSLTEQGREALFKIAIKSYIQEDGWYYPNESLKEMFKLDFDFLSKLKTDRFERHEIGFGVKWFYSFPTNVSANDLKPLAEFAQKYGLKGLALILRTVCSCNLVDYKKFADEILHYKDEILEYGEERLIKQNKLMSRIWGILRYGLEYDFSLEELLNEESPFGKGIAESLKMRSPISTWQEYVRENQKQFSLLSSSCIKDISFPNVYREILKHISQESILSHHSLCFHITFFYAASLQSAYMNYKNESGINDFPEWTSDLMQFFITILRFSKISACSSTKYEPWTDVLWEFAFLLIRTPKTWTEFCDFPFYEMQPFGTSIGYKTEFSNKDNTAIINGAIDYIRHTENASAYAFLHNFVLQENVDYQCLENVDWSRLNPMWGMGEREEKKLQCLAKVVQAEDRAKIEEMLKTAGELHMFLQDDETFDFILQVLLEKKIPYKLVPILIFYLDSYRKKISEDIYGDKQDVKNKIRLLEKKIKDILTAQPISL